ncbi:MAG: four helix bundle protein [Planctomycetota bacterium]|nr:four helix bundle protein [Planctomycetota bacterium]
MAKLIHAERFQDLAVYQKAWQVSRTIYQLSKSFPKEETYSLTSQVRRSSRSVGAQIAEAWAKRRYPREFVRKMTEADAEQMETQHWIREAFACGFIDEATGAHLTESCGEIGRMLAAMIAKTNRFCGKYDYKVEEEPAAYGLADDFFDEFMALEDSQKGMRLP